MAEALEELARQALTGDRNAVEQLVRRLQPDVYRLALRVLWQPENAEDATQEILIRVITRLSRFEGQSRLSTWVYRVATNYLLDVKKSAAERWNLSFDVFAADLLEGLSTDGPAEHERAVLVEEVKIGCTLGMLQCLDRGHRLAYVLGEILELSAEDAAEALGVSAAVYRKRLQRARSRVEHFAREHCGLVSDGAACRCHRRVPAAVSLGRVVPDRPQFAQQASAFVDVRQLVRKAEAARRVVELHRSNHPQVPEARLARSVLSALEA